MKTSRLIIVIVCVGLFSVSAGGATTWWMLKQHGVTGTTATAQAPPAEVVDTRAYKYVSLDKIVVMLRNAAGESVSHYIALDLVFMAPLDSERTTRDHLPLLRSVTVQALSALTMESATRLSVEELTAQLNDAFTQTYASDPQGKPFARAMIGKLIIE